MNHEPKEPRKLGTQRGPSSPGVSATGSVASDSGPMALGWGRCPSQGSGKGARLSRDQERAVVGPFPGPAGVAEV